MYAKCGVLPKAQEVFKKLPAARNAITWNVLLAGYAQHMRVDEALSLLSTDAGRGPFPRRNRLSLDFESLWQHRRY